MSRFAADLALPPIDLRPRSNIRGTSMNDFNRKVREASARVNKSVAEAAERLEKETVPAVRRLDVFKALAMGALKHSLHSCFFCYHQRTATLEEEVAFFERRLGKNRALEELLLLRHQYRRSIGFVIPRLPTLARLHLWTARDNRSWGKVVGGG
jgi:hypothetical protein